MSYSIPKQQTQKKDNMLSQEFQIHHGMRGPILSTEKPNNTIGHPLVPFRKVLDGITHILRT